MNDRNNPEPVGERNLRILIAAAQSPAAPPLSRALAEKLAAHARESAASDSRWPAAAAGCSLAGLLMIALLLLLPAGRMDLRFWMAALPAANLLLGPFAAAVVIRLMHKEAIHGKT